MSQEFHQHMRERLAEPMLTDEPRTVSSLDPGISDFDEAPGTFEDDVLARLENMQNDIDEIVSGNTHTRTVIDTIAANLETVMGQVEPTIAMVMESKLFRMFVPKPKGT